MANTASAQKRIRSNERKRIRNQRTRSRTRTAVRLARSSLAGAIAEEGRKAAPGAAEKARVSLEDARKNVLAAASALDRAAAKGVLHKNNAARRKSRLMKKLAALEKAGR